MRTLDRRTMLRGMGTALSLPLLDAMIPARAGAQANQHACFVWFYQPNGFHTPNRKRMGDHVLQYLEEFREDIQIVGGLVNPWYREYKKVRNPHLVDDHRAPNNSFVRPIPPTFDGGGFNEGTLRKPKTYDHYIADALGIANRGINRLGILGYKNTSRWQFLEKNHYSFSATNQPLKLHLDPGELYRQLVGNGVPEQMDRVNNYVLLRRRSVLDFVLPELRRLKARIGPADRAKVEQYLTGVEAVERQLTEFQQGAGGLAKQCGLAELQGRVTADSKHDDFNYADKMNLWLDLLVIALQCGRTRSAYLSWGNNEMAFGDSIDGWKRKNGDVIKLQGSSSWHTASHGDGGTSGNLEPIEEWVSDRFGHFLRKLKGTPMSGAAANLLEASVVVWGASMAHLSWGAGEASGPHADRGLSYLIAGQGYHRYRKGRPDQWRIRFPAGDPKTQELFFTLMKDHGVSAASYGEFSKTLELDRT